MMHITSLKSITKNQEIEYLPDPEFLWMALGSYQNQMKALVNQGEYVKKYQLIAQSEDHWFTKLHSPVSGFVEGVVEVSDQSYLKLKNDFEEKEIEKKTIDLKALSKQELLDLIRDSGIVGSGGAGFPTHVKYNTEGNPISYFIINGAECEPFLSSDYVLMKQEGQRLMDTVSVIQKLTGAREVVLAIEKQHRELKAPMQKWSQQANLSLRVHLLENEYPQGGELQIIKSVTGKELPKGSIPARYGVIVSNLGTVYAISNSFFNGQPYIDRIVTISGDKINKRGNFRLKIGTPVSYILEQIGSTWDLEHHEVILGGPMMGKAVSNPEASIGKGTGGVLILEKKKINSYNCIQCGYCSDVCPQHLMPLEFVRYASRDDIEGLEKYQLNSCIECGACAYACPSDVPLMESINKGKLLIRRDQK